MIASKAATASLMFCTKVSALLATLAALAVFVADAALVVAFVTG